MWVHAMENYEIRIRKGGGGPIIYAGPHFSDGAAVRIAREITGEQDIVEVWHGGDCVFSRNVNHPPAR